ncbi:MAG: capsular biosynthesis protein [Sphingomonadaceae bacterium]
MSAPTFLFLQGLPGPSSRLIARELQRRGARTLRVNCNGGDLFDWRGGGLSYRGRADAFGTWLGAVCARERVRALVLFGADRPLHRAAIDLARREGIDVFVLEEGYLRPSSVTLEHWPKGQAWLWPTSLEDCARRAGSDPGEVPVAGHFRPRMVQSVFHALASVLQRPLYPHYRSHRPRHALLEMLAWNRRWLRGPWERRCSRRALNSVGSLRFFLLPLQIDGDASLVHRSRFGGMAQAISEIVADFSSNAPQDAHLLVKRHPLDPDIAGWRRVVERIAAGDPRIHFIEHGDLDALLVRCAGVVTVNSSVGALALAQGKPVHALGRALYVLTGLSDPGPLARFWADPQAPAPGAYESFRRALWNECLLNAGFHSREGLARLAPLAAERMLEKAA